MKRGGGADTPGFDPSVSPDGLPPPRSVEELRRVKHRTVGAPEANVRFARQLRGKMTLPEVLLWQRLRARPRGFRFRRQFPVIGYVVDFACLERRLAIEVDGEGHGSGDRPQRDEQRDARLGSLGFETLRIPARDVLEDLDAALRFIVDRCENRPRHPPRAGEDL